VLTHAFDARSYGPWLAAIAWFAYTLVRTRSPRPGLLMNMGVAASAIFVSTVHYFGIVSLLLVVVAELAARRALRAPVWNGMLAVFLGPLALLASIPMLQSQRAAIGVPTWMPPVQLHAAVAFLNEVLFQPSLALVAIAAVACALVYKLRHGKQAAPGWSEDLGFQAASMSLLLLPLFLVGFSFTFYTVLMPRYSLPAVAPVAVVAAALCSRMTNRWIVALVGCLVVSAGWELKEQARVWREEQAYNDRLIAVIRRDTGSEDVLFESPAKLYVVCRYAPDLVDRCYLIDFEEHEVANASKNRLFMRDLARRFAEFYVPPRVKTVSSLHGLVHSFLVPTFFTGGEIGSQWDDLYPGFRVRRVSRELCDIVPRAAKPDTDGAPIHDR
jgi:hypothetical protein